MATYWEIAAHSAYDMFSWYKCLIVNLVFRREVFNRSIDLSICFQYFVNHLT